MNCPICNEPLGSTRAIWGYNTETDQCHLDCIDALAAFLLASRSTGNSYVRGVIEVLLTGTRETLTRERLGAS